MINDLKKWAEDNGYFAVHQKEDGTIVALLENPFNTQIIVGEEFSVNERYTYETKADGLIAYYYWIIKDCVGEPAGWIRHQPSGRRREHGDPNKETIRE